MLSGFTAGALALFGGAKRWLNGEAGKALGFAIVAVCILLGAVLLYGAGGAGREAKVNWRWLSKLNALNAQRAVMVAQEAAEMTKAANQARLHMEFQRNLAVTHAIALEQELAKLKTDPELYSRDERRRLFKR